MTEKKTMGAKICLLGDGGVGKTSLIRRYVLDMFDDKYIQTIGTKVTKKVLDMDTDAGSVSLKMMIWDIMGQATARTLRDVYYRDAKGAIIVYDITNRESFKNVHDWALSLFNVASKVPIVIVGNKWDLKEEKTVSEDEAAELAGHYNSAHYFTSAKTGENVETAFRHIGNAVVGHLLGINANAGRDMEWERV